MKKLLAVVLTLALIFLYSLSVLAAPPTNSGIDVPGQGNAFGVGNPLQGNPGQGNDLDVGNAGNKTGESGNEESGNEESNNESNNDNNDNNDNNNNNNNNNTGGNSQDQFFQTQTDSDDEEVLEQDEEVVVDPEEAAGDDAEETTIDIAPETPAADEEDLPRTSGTDIIFYGLGLLATSGGLVLRKRK